MQRLALTCSEGSSSAVFDQAVLSPRTRPVGFCVGSSVSDVNLKAETVSELRTLRLAFRIVSVSTRVKL